MPKHPVERKVTAASVAAYVGSTALLAVLAAVQDGALVDVLPDTAAPFVLALVPTAVTFVSGWKARHTPRGRYEGPR